MSWEKCVGLDTSMFDCRLTSCMQIISDIKASLLIKNTTRWSPSIDQTSTQNTRLTEHIFLSIHELYLHMFYIGAMK